MVNLQDKLPLLTALVSMAFSNILLLLVFFIARRHYRDRFSSYWLLGWGFYAVRSGFEIAEALAPGIRAVAAGNLVALCGSSIYLFTAATRLKDDKPGTRLPEIILALCASVIAAAELLELDRGLIVLIVFTAAGFAQMATSIPFIRYRRISATPSPAAAALALVLLGTLNLSYYYLRPNPVLAPMAFQLGSLLRITLGIAVAVILFEASREEARRSAARYQALFHSLTDAVYIIDFTDGRLGRFLEVNDQATRALGYSQEELLNLEPRDIECEGQIPPEDLGIIWSSKEVMLRRIHVSKTGERIPVDISAQKFMLDGRPAVLGVARDVREREENEARLREAVAEKEVLLRELHHRVKNNLQIIASLLSLQKESVSDPAAVDALEESRSRVASIALVHELLYNDHGVGTIELKQYFQELSRQIGLSRSRDGGIAVKVEGSDLRYGMDRAIPAGLIVAELVTNAFKYAFRGLPGGTIRITVGVEGDHDTVMVSDDGVGFGDPEKSAKSLGLSLVDILAKQLGGKIEKRGVERGAAWKLSIPSVEET